jgi:hypothetical protein
VLPGHTEKREKENKLVSSFMVIFSYSSFLYAIKKRRIENMDHEKEITSVPWPKGFL